MVDLIAKDKLAFVYVGGHEKESRSFVSTFFFSMCTVVSI